MSRTVLAIALVVALFGGLVLVFVWYLSFGMGTPGYDDVRLRALDQEARLSYRKDGSVTISAATELDGYRALGYQTGHDHGWTVALLRQTATGRLGEWFGDSVFRLDAFAKRLGFGSTARESAAGLRPDDARALAAYAEGMSEALNERDVALGNDFVLFDIHPESWQPWHSLAIERMIAWLAEPPLSPSPSDSAFSDSTYWAIRDLEDADRQFRSWLHIHGADMSAAWAWSDSARTRFTARFVYGATTLPLYSAVSMRWPGVSVDGVVLLGTPFLPVVSGPSGTLITLISSDRGIETVSVGRDADRFEHRHERISNRWGDETLVSVTALDDRILIEDLPSRRVRDSVFSIAVLDWSGSKPVTDWPAWRAAVLIYGSGGSVTGGVADFRVVDGDGLLIDADGVHIVGEPVVRETNGGRVFVANHPAAEYVADQIDDLEIDLDDALHEDESAWARENAPLALAMIDTEDGYSGHVAEALEYLRNWDFRYDVTSIGASIFDSWMLHFRDRRGSYPEILIPPRSDSLGVARLKGALRHSLEVAVDSLVRIAGPDLARWRLEYLRRGGRYFPVWSYAPLHEDLPALNRSRYAPIEIPQGGHPTTLTWQPGLDDDPANSPSHLLVTGIAGISASLAVRPDYDIGTGFVARYVAGPPSEPSADADEVSNEIVLRPVP